MSADPRARWGFHQLHPSYARRLVRAAEVRPSDLVLDIGAGAGVITAELLARGARVIAIELHPGRAALLRARFADDECTVVRADATDLRLPRRPFRVVSNPPFASVTAILRRLTAPGSRLERADLIVPAYVAARWTSDDAPGARRWIRTFEVGIGERLSRDAFQPPATMRTVRLVLTRRSCPRG